MVIYVTGGNAFELSLKINKNVKEGYKLISVYMNNSQHYAWLQKDK